MNDLISRSEVWKAFISRVDSICDLVDVREILDSIPTAEPKVGRWIPYKAYFGKSKDSWTDELKCSECDYEWGDEDYNFCPNCGAKMERRANAID